ncbi:MAG TPA: hypothetical protein VMD59_11335 [Acidimicrobiales bacterium]|nr:hypothetical protein [Acidimicrobiales bacterium]
MRSEERAGTAPAPVLLAPAGGVPAAVHDAVGSGLAGADQRDTEQRRILVDTIARAGR